ncbi:MAG: serine hydrolase [Patescibacteria group bacterium]|nr:serine hydrolase [Patescibacteria group bacterium]MDD5294714.1 serine hydrolase [Patescibacteria group bacterium]MDD5554419.1 serine hydrolase [Patescibacteria group bacterium]
MLISALTSLIITAMIFSFAISPAKPGFSFDIFGALAGDKGEVLGVDEQEMGEAVGRAVEEIKRVPLAGRILPESPDKPAGPQKLPASPANLGGPDAGDFIITAKSAAAVDRESGALLFSYQPDEITPIASLTKLMTALVFLDHNPGWDSVYEIKREDRREGGKIFLFLGERVTVKDLFYLSLVASDNTAAIALVRSSLLSEEEFVKEMNRKALSLGLTKTKFSDPIGLNNNNVSTAREIAQLAKAAFSSEDIRQATLNKEYEFKTLGGKRKKVLTTDYLLENFPANGLKIIGGKTGYTELAGYCFAGEFAHEDSQEIVTVILGGPTSSSRFKETKDLAEWIYENYEW